MEAIVIRQWKRWLRRAAVVLLMSMAVIALHEPILRAAGRALVVTDALRPADVIVIALDAGGAGALEAGDLVVQGIATQVAVFVDPPSGEDHEFLRRGLPYEDETARQIRQLELLGVTNVLRIPRTNAGTQGEGDVLPSWSKEHDFRSMVVVTTTDHSRRLRRVLQRSMSGYDISMAIRPSRYSAFDPDQWWRSRGGIRTGIVELQKLVLDFALHPVTLASGP